MNPSHPAGPAAAQQPSDAADVSVSPPPGSAGGLGAITQTWQQLRQHTGLIRGTRVLLQLNQPGGFDCPGCAWPEPHSDERPSLEFCENGVKAIAWEATTRRIGREFFAQHSVAELAAQSDYWLGQQGRLSEPLYLPPGGSHYQPISWDAAFACIGSELRRLPSPDHAVFYTSGRTSNEAAFLFQLLVRLYGTNNLPDCSDLCHESSGVALRETIGVGKGTVQLADFDQCDAIFILGQNPGTNHPRMLTMLKRAAERGCEIVAINPLSEAALVRFRHPQEPEDVLGEGTAIATLHLPVRIGGDAALLKGIMKEILAEAGKPRPAGAPPILDHDFITSQTHGFSELVAALAQVSWDDIVRDSGIERAQIRAAAEVWLRSRRIIACWAMGLTQHKAAVATIQEVVNLLLLGGHIGRPGSGLCPVRGHSNVQGDRTMGITENPEPAFLSRLGTHFGFTPPGSPGYDTVAAINAMLAGQVGVFFALGGNFLSASPDTERTAEALRRCELTVQVSTKLHRSHLVVGRQALILPCLGRSDRDVQASGPQIVSVENSMGIVHASTGTLPAASPQLRSEVAIVCGLAQALLFAPWPTAQAAGRIDWGGLSGNYDHIREHIAAVIPGFADYNQRLRHRDGFVLPNAARERRFATGSGRAMFTVHPLPEQTLTGDQLLLMTLRSHDQFNTTIYGLDDRYRGIAGGRRVLFMNPQDLSARGIGAGERVDITSHFSGQQRVAHDFVVVPYAIPPRCAAAYFPEANVLVPLDSIADKSRTPTSKSIVITVARRIVAPA
jgi:molybdopterin-dependent oxidoreductase alpha subunit